MESLYAAASAICQLLASHARREEVESIAVQPIAVARGAPTSVASTRSSMWLRKTVLKKIADNGGNVPKELLG
ncbi:MAG: hypothetical protein U1F54_21220 [Burkholderiales bacterium]